MTIHSVRLIGTTHQNLFFFLKFARHHRRLQLLSGDRKISSDRQPLPSDHENDKLKKKK